MDSLISDNLLVITHIVLMMLKIDIYFLDNSEANKV